MLDFGQLSPPKKTSLSQPGIQETLGPFSRSAADSLGYASMLVYLSLDYMCLPASMKVY